MTIEEKPMFADRPAIRNAHTVMSILNLPVLLAVLTFMFSEWRAFDRATRENRGEISDVKDELKRLDTRVSNAEKQALNNERALMMQYQEAFTDQDGRDMETADAGQVGTCHGSL